jgi:hypothetical protein
MVGSDHDLQWPTGFIQAIDHTAIKQLELVVGTDRIVRVDIDGICALRVRMLDGCEYITDDRRGRL